MASRNDNGPPNDGAPHPADEQQPRQPSNQLAPTSPSNGVIAAAGETSSSALAAREKAGVEARYLMAMHRPRNPDNARARVLARCLSFHFAEVAEYSKPIGDKKVTGPSIRMMEELGRQWGNIDVGSYLIFDDERRQTYRVYATDLETNYSQSTDVMIEKTVERRFPKKGDVRISSRENSQGQTVWKIEADEDAFLPKKNANISKARREMIRAVLPGDLVEEAMAKCAATRKGESEKDPAAARKRLADSFFSLGVMPAQLAELLAKPSLEAVTTAELEVLRSIYTSMKEGETTWAEEVDARRESGAIKTAPVGASAKLSESLKKKEPPKPCSFCGRTDGTHDPAKACYTDPD